MTTLTVDPAAISPSGTTTFDRTVAYVGELVAAGAVATGAQLAIALGGRTIVDVAFGTTLDRPMRTDHLHPGFCVSKPLLGLAVGLLMDRGLITLRETISWPHHEGTADGVTVAQLLNHRAGLDRPTALEWRLCPDDERPALLRQAPFAPGPAYSELVAGLALESTIAERIGVPAGDLIEREILGPLGLADDLIVTARAAEDRGVRARAAVPVAGLPDRAVPLLSERIPLTLRELRPAFGSLVTASALCRLYTGLEVVSRGRVVEGLPTPATLQELRSTARGRASDRLLERPCDFSGGFMIGLTDHGFGHLVSPEAFGFVGGIAPAVGFCDPDARVAAAFYLNGSVLEHPQEAEGVRSRIVDTIIEEARHGI